ncbi:DUF1800 domain-containing protein [Acaryochloris sp. IP29b_bin.148]|uniref:DUF1800 domain-containing protein n=1 Tax=Acaryochloris sp. IP29b_bin.148 TaxID=2969218 RepID=UPI002629C754|nr:DUF1800 domain-containing protein [Acaryochloris sp. IP29b_bin.148]
MTTMALQPALAVPTEVTHVINRLSFGPSPGDLQHIQAVGIDGYIQEQLSPEQYPPELQRQLRQYPTLSLTSMQLERQYGVRRPGSGKLNPQELKQRRRRSRIPLHEASEVRLIRAISSPNQLEEVMVNFWFNHFNVSAQKGRTGLWVGSYEQEAIRPYVFGSFRDLLGATAKHPAMLFYLDNWQNTAPNSAGARGRFKGLNENYARELLELHTMGVKGGYSQADVVSAAKILTGWGFPRGRQRLRAQQVFYFDARRHDNSRKTFLGRPIRGQGLAEGEELLNILATHPATAQHISYKLAQYFVADTPPQALVDRLAQRFLATDGNIQAVLATLFESPEFRDPQYCGQKFKTPYEYLLSMARAAGRPSVQPRLVMGALRQFSMPLYACSTPQGYANTESAWLNPDATLRRISLATAFARGYGRQRIPVQSNQLEQTLGDRFSAQTQAVINSSPQRLRAALMLGSPEMMYR